MLSNIFQNIGAGIMTVGIAIAGLFGVHAPEPTVGATIPVSTAVFQTSLQNSIGASDTSMTLVSGTNKAGNNLSGYMCFNIDEGTSLEEFVCGTTSGTAVTSMIRGVDPVDGDTEVTALKKSHRRGASVKITDYPSIAILSRILNGNETIPNIIQYASGVVPSTQDDIADKGYVDGVAVAGAPNATTTVQGLVEEGTQAEVDARTTTGGTGAKLFAPLDKIRASKYHDYAADAGANDTYTATITPAPTAYSAGQFFTFKANTVNTGAATVNFNGLGAKSLKMNSNLDPVDGYIKANADVVVVYDGTNMQIVSVSGKPSVSQTGEEVYAGSTSGNDTYAITLTPAPVAYTTGMLVHFKVDTANTGTASLNVNALGAKTLKKDVSSDLETGDILANTIVSAIYDGTNFQVVSRTPIGGFFNSVPNTEATSATWFTWTTPLLVYIDNGPTYVVPGFTGTLGNPNGGDMGGAGVTLLSRSGGLQLYTNLPGTTSNTNYTAAASKDIKIKLRVKFSGAAGAGEYQSFGIADNTGSFDDIQTATPTGIRFVLNNATLYVVSSDGSANTNTNISGSVTYTNWNTFEFVFNPGTDVKFYANGTLLATHTTNLPTGSLQYFGFGTTTSGVTLGWASPITFSLEQ